MSIEESSAKLMKESEQQAQEQDLELENQSAKAISDENSS